MTDTSYEEATRCPKCSIPGQVRSKKSAPPAAGLKPKTQVHMVYCVNERCKWYDTPWTVQVNPDGSVPPPQNHTGRNKVYSGIEGHDDQANAIIDALRINADKETSTGAEITRGGRYL